MDADLVVKRLMTYFQVDSQTELANKLGLKKAVLSNWKARGRVNWALIFEKCPDIDLNCLISSKQVETKVNKLISKPLSECRECLFCLEKERTITILQGQLERCQDQIDRMLRDAETREKRT